MKRVFTAFLAAVLVFLCSGCVALTEPPQSTATTTTTTQGYRDLVYVTPYGKKYHRNASCAGENATPTERETAALYYDPCKKCAGG